MSTVTYHNQPGIHKTRGSVPLAGTEHAYRVGKVLWPATVEDWIESKLIGTTVHICCGRSQLGDVRVDIDPEVFPDIVADAANLHMIADQSFDTVVCDPPYNGKFRWMHDMLNELHRIAKHRIIFQHWFSPVDKQGRFKKAHVFELTDSAVVQTLEPDNVMLSVYTDGALYSCKVEESSHTFILSDLTYWQPRTYFGRVQLISVLDKVNSIPDSSGNQWSWSIMGVDNG